MNWYQLIKFAQIWNKEYDEYDINEMLTVFYELEYIYSQLKLRSFKGHPQRKNNILKNVIKELTITSQDLIKVLINTYKKWHHPFLRRPDHCPGDPEHKRSQCKT